MGKLTAADWRLIEQLDFLLRLRAQRRPGRKPYVMPSQTWLAKAIGVTREHVSRRTSRLHALGVLVKTWRRPINGEYQTCLYELTPVIRWGIQRMINLFRSLGKSVINTSHKLASTYRNRSLWSRGRSPPGPPRG